eukprot:4107333-Amphidinium_carterae.1
MASNPLELKAMYSDLVSALAGCGLRVNPDKSSLLCRHVRPRCLQEFPQQSQLRFLGMDFDLDMTTSIIVNGRLHAFWQCYYKHVDIYQASRLPVKGRLLYFHRTARAAGIYGLETLRPSPALSKPLAAAENGV